MSASASACAEITRAPAAAAQIVAKCVLPEPSGPISAMARAGQSGQESISAKRVRVARTRQKIVSRKAFGVIERERKLARA